VNATSLAILQAVNALPTGAAVSDLLVADQDRTTLYRRLKSLIGDGLIQPSGQGRWTRYALTQAGKAALGSQYFEQPPHLRAPARFNPRVLDEYIPNTTRYLDWDVSAGLQSLARLDVSVSQRLLEAFLIDLSFASSKMEGSTLSWLETTALIEYGDTAGKDYESVTLVLAHKDAIRHLIDNRLSLSTRDVKDLHALVSKGVFPSDASRGKLRERLVSISGSTYSPSDVPSVTREAFEQFCEKAQRIDDPLEAAVFTMLFIPYIQPFEDANKRTSRIAMNIPLLGGNLCPFSFTHLSPQVYLRSMIAFYELNDPSPAVACFNDGYRKGLERFPELRARVEEHDLSADGEGPPSDGWKV
jgi:DNA-binding transcriptional ArsR family regulator